MTAPTTSTKEKLISAVNEFKRERCANDASATKLKFAEIMGCPIEEALEKPEMWAGAIEKLKIHTEAARERLRSHDYERILEDIQSIPDAGCNEEQRRDIYRSIATAEGLALTERDHLINVLKKKLPGKPQIESIRKEIDLIARLARRVKVELPPKAQLILFAHHELSTFFGGVWDPDTDTFIPGFALSPQPRKDVRDNLCAFMGKPPLQIYPMGVLEFRPGQSPQVKKTSMGYVVNTWTAPPLRAQAKASSTVPAAIAKVLMHVLGGCKKSYEHFINWVAVAYQTNNRTGTAWVIRGTEGTGKGILWDIILKELFGYLHSRRAVQMMESQVPWTEWLEKAVFLRINEADVAEPDVRDMLKEIITDPTLTVRERNKPDRTIDNYANVVITSNKSHAIAIPEDDRRYNVAPFQEAKLESVIGVGNGAAFVEQVKTELPEFAGFLAGYAADVELARQPLKNDARNTVIGDSERTPDKIRKAILDGDLDFFLEEYWTSVGETVSLEPRAVAARKALLEWAKHANPPKTLRAAAMRVPTKQVADVYNLLMPEKFSRAPTGIGRTLGLNSGKGRTGRGRAYMVTWHTKMTRQELDKTIGDLTRVSPPADEDPVPAEDFNKEAQVAASAPSPGESSPVPDAEAAFASIVDCPEDAVERMKALFVAHGLEPTAEENLDEDNTVTVRAPCPNKAAALEFEEKIIAEFIALEKEAA
jgi:hypothetical protein